MAPLSWFPQSVAELLPRLPRKVPIWLVGGAIRDALLGQEAYDLDFAVDGEATRVARQVANELQGAYYTLDAARDAGRVIATNANGQRLTLDFARLRGADIEADLLARDFTVDALAVSLDDPEHLLDPTGGLQDLKDRWLRACTPRAIEEDPVRALRAVRLAAELNLRIDRETLKQVALAKSWLAAVSPERIRDEFLRMFQATRPGRGLKVLDHLGLLEIVCPELTALKGLEQPAPHALDAWDHTLAVVDRLSELLLVLGPVHDEEAAADQVLAHAVLRLGRYRAELRKHLEASLTVGRDARELLYFAALYHDVGKPASRSQGDEGGLHFYGHEHQGAELAAARAQALRLSRVEADRIRLIIRNHLRPGLLEASPPVTPRAVYRFFRQTGEAGVDVVLLSLADLLGTFAPGPPEDAWLRRLEVGRVLLEAILEGPRERLDPPPLVRGHELLEALRLEPGPEVGRLLEAIREAQAAGEIRTKAEALALAERLRLADGANPSVSSEEGRSGPSEAG